MLKNLLKTVHPIPINIAYSLTPRENSIRNHHEALIVRSGMTVQQQFRQAVLPFINNAAAAMDYPKVYDSELNHLNNSSVLSFLAHKKTPALTRKLFTDSVDTDAGQQSPSTVLPSYSFTITGFRIGQHVEYEVTLQEQYQILKRTLTNHYHFRTRYSLLEALDEKLGGAGLPAKKWFGNRSVQFVEKRRGELEDYLNRAARSRKAAFYKFVSQIKNTDFNEGLKLPFSIE